MRLYARLGRREAALRQYQLCVDGLKRELSTEPEAETTQLYQEVLRSRPIRADRAPASGPARGEPAPAPIADLLSAAAAALPDAPPPTNLPAPTSELIGRAAALAEVTELLGVHRLVTLIGAGGIGKTRLGLEVARQQLPRHADGVWVAELAPLSDPGLVPVTVAVALGLTLPAGAGSPERVAAALGTKRLLLVLDNCEHVIEAAAHMAEAVLRADPHARVLATSREPLRAPGEYVYRVLPLEVPAEGAQDREALLDAAAVQLFVARAQATDRALLPGRAQRADRGRGLSAPRRHPARDRAGGGPHRHARDGRARRPSGRSIPAAHRRPPDRATAAPDPAGDARLELRAAPRDRAHGPAPPGHLRGRLHAGGGECRRDGRRPRRARGRGPRHEPGREVARRRGGHWRGHGIPAARDDAGLRAREAHRERRARPGGPTPRRVLPRPLRAGRDPMGDAPHRRLAGRARPPDRQHADRAGLGLLSERRRVDRGGAHRRGGAPVVSAVAHARVSRPRRAGARQPRTALGSRRAPRDAARRRARRVAHADQGPRARHHRGLDDRPRDRRAPRRHRVSAAGALGPVAFPRQPRRVPSRAGAGGALLRPGGQPRQSGRAAGRRANGRRLPALPGGPGQRAAAPRAHARVAMSPRLTGRTPSASSTTSRWRPA